MTTILIENKPYEVADGQNLLQASLSLGFNLPYFCWHPALGSVGACRQCAVKAFKDEKDQHGKLVMACMEPVSQGKRISIEDPEASEFRASVIEWMMVSHPHDCPICDEGGECHLQDMTVMTGHNYRCFRGGKRTFRNQDLGPLVNQEMNRCIQCYRCVRFYRDYADGRDFDAFGMRDQVFFGRFEDGTLESEFSGNLVEVCPTGVFTDKTLKEHYTRKWDLQTAPSICVHCSLGCNTILGERYGKVRRVRNRYNSQVNGYFLCDRGRYGYEFVNNEGRILYPRLVSPLEVSGKDGRGAAQALSKESALRHLSALLTGKGIAIGIGSPRATLEANYALRTLVGPNNFYQGVSERDRQMVSTIIEIYKRGPAQIPTLQEVALADAVFVLGEDVSNTAPMLALALRQSVRQKSIKKAKQLHIPAWNVSAVSEAALDEKSPLYLATAASTHLEDVATSIYHAAPAELARLGFAVARELGADLPELNDLPESVRSIARRIAQALREAEKPLVVSGTGLGSLDLLQSAADVAWALCAGGQPAQLFYTLPECNSLGLGLMGGGGLEAAQERKAETVFILENDLYRCANPDCVDAFLRATSHVVVLDHLENATSSMAEILLPVSTFAESDGTLVNNEGRAQRYYQVMMPAGEAQESWKWLQELRIAFGHAEAWKNPDDVSSALAKEMPVFEPILQIAPPAGFHIVGQKIPRQPARYSGRAAMVANLDVNEPKPPDDPDSPFAFSMEGYPGQPPSALIPRYWSPGWNSVQALNKFQSEVGGPLRGGDPGKRLVTPGANVSPTYFRSIPAAFEAREEEWLVVPLYHIFGSEELSILTPGIASLIPHAYLGLNAEDAARIGVNEGDEINLSINDTKYILHVKLIPSLPSGVAGMPAGLPDIPWSALPASGILSNPEVTKVLG